MFTFRSSFIGECWQKMKMIKAEFEQSESGEGLQSRKVGEERVRDERPLREWMTKDVRMPVHSPIRASGNICCHWEK